MAPIPGSVRVTGFIAPSDSADLYATQDEFYNRGGWRTVADITARNAITADRRKDGMIVRVRNAGGGIEKFYTLTGGLADINWVEQVFSGGTGYYPKYLVGVGATYPFNTIQAAINQALTDGKGTAAAPALVLVDAGIYTENLTLHEHVHVIGLAGEGPEWPVEIRGSATYSPTAPAATDNQLNISNVKLVQSTADTPVLTVTGAAASALVNLHGCGIYKTFGATAANLLVNATSATQVSLNLWNCSVHRLWALAGKLVEYTGAVVATSTILSLVETDMGDLDAAEFPGTAIDMPRGSVAVVDRCNIEGAILLGANITAGVFRGDCSFTHNGAAVMNVAAGAVNVEMVSCTIDTDTAPTVTGAGIFKYAIIRFKNVQGFAPTLNAGAGALPIVIDDASNIRYSNLVSLLTATNAQAAIDELAGSIIAASGGWAMTLIGRMTNIWSVTPTTIMTGVLPGDLQTAINAMADGDVLWVQTDATYTPITIPAGKEMTVLAAPGYTPKITGAKGITLLNGVTKFTMGGFTLTGCSTPDPNAIGSSICLDHYAIVTDVTFYRMAIRETVSGSGVMLSYHQSTGGDFYYTNPLIGEMSRRVAFIDCYFGRAGVEPTEGANLSLRGINTGLIHGCKIDGFNLTTRGIGLQNCLDMIVQHNEVLNIGGGNAEAIKFDVIATSPLPAYRISGLIARNRIKTAKEGIDVDDHVGICNVIDNVVSECSVTGIGVDGGTPYGRAQLIGNTVFNCGVGILLEVGSVAELSGNTCFNNTTNFSILNGYVLGPTNTTSPSNTTRAVAHAIAYDPTASGLAAKTVQAAIDALAAAGGGKVFKANQLPVEVPNGVLDTFTLPGGDQYVANSLLVMLNGAIYQPASISQIGPGYTQFQIVGGDTIPKAVDSFTVSYSKF